MEINKFKSIVNRISEIIAGTKYENHVFVVGGCVRDMYIGHEIKDIDIVVDLPDGGIELAKWLFDSGFLKSHPIPYPTYSTAMFVLKEFPNVELEAVQTRKEKYEDSTNRNPVTAFGTIEEDCYRRDFTTNSLYYNISTHEYLDITGKGREDISNGILRTPLNPDETFDDDPLRILRCIRFAVRYNWKIEQKTYDAIIKNAHRLSIVTHERIQQELVKMLSSDNPYYAIRLLSDTRTAHYIFKKELAGYTKEEDFYERFYSMTTAFSIFENIQKAKHDDMSYIVYLALIMLFITNNKNGTEIYNIMDNLRFSKKEISAVWKIFNYVNMLMDYHRAISKKEMRKLQYECHDEKLFSNCLDLYKIISETIVVQNIEQAERITYFDKEEYGCTMFDYQLPVNGWDIMENSGARNSRIKEIMSCLLDEVFCNPSLSKKQLLEKMCLCYLTEDEKKILNN